PGLKQIRQHSQCAPLRHGARRKCIINRYFHSFRFVPNDFIYNQPTSQPTNQPTSPTTPQLQKLFPPRHPSHPLGRSRLGRPSPGLSALVPQPVVAPSTIPKTLLIPATPPLWQH